MGKLWGFLPLGVVRKLERVRVRERMSKKEEGKRWIEEESILMKDKILESKNTQSKSKERAMKNGLN